MLLVKTYLGLSDRHGIGLFASQFIPKGTITWEYTYEFDAGYTQEQAMILSAPAREQFFKYTYFDKELDRYILCFDDQRFINHCSVYPNILSTPRRDIASHDIREGEELLCNYNGFDDGYFNRLGIEEASLVSVVTFSPE
jgi:SET domain-containing protein